MLCELFMDECYWLCGGKPAGNDGRSGGSCICPVGVWGLENFYRTDYRVYTGLLIFSVIWSWKSKTDECGGNCAECTFR